MLKMILSGLEESKSDSDDIYVIIGNNEETEDI